MRVTVGAARVSVTRVAVVVRVNRVAVVVRVTRVAVVVRVRRVAVVGEHHEHSLRELDCLVIPAVPGVLHTRVAKYFCWPLVHVVGKPGDPVVCSGLIHQSSLAMVLETRHQLNQ